MCEHLVEIVQYKCKPEKLGIKYPNPNCGKTGHTIENCFPNKGGGKEEASSVLAPWQRKKGNQEAKSAAAKDQGSGWRDVQEYALAPMQIVKDWHRVLALHTAVS